tara:strand:+ start:456 stop:911 length:456 start_codon:yes stop_codon:yes gene_type:complete
MQKLSKIINKLLGLFNKKTKSINLNKLILIISILLFVSIFITHYINYGGNLLNFKKKESYQCKVKKDLSGIAKHKELCFKDTLTESKETLNDVKENYNLIKNKLKSFEKRMRKIEKDETQLEKGASDMKKMNDNENATADDSAVSENNPDW